MAFGGANVRLGFAARDRGLQALLARYGVQLDDMTMKSRQAAEQVEQSADTAARGWGRVAVAAAAAGAAIVKAARDGVREWSQLDVSIRQTANIVEGADAAWRQRKSAEILGLAGSTGANLQTLGTAAFTTASGSARGQLASDVLRLAAQAEMTFPNLSAANAASRITQGMQQTGLGPESWLDAMVRAADIGQTDFARLSHVVPRIIEPANVLDLDPRAAMGLLGHATQATGTTEEASTQLRALMTTVVKADSPFAQAFKETTGLAFSEAIRSQGFIQALAYAYDEMGKLRFSDTLGREAAGVGAFIGRNPAAAQAAVDAVVGSGGAFAEDYSLVEGSLRNRTAQLRGAISAQQTRIGQAAAPGLTDLVTELKAIVTGDEVTRAAELLGTRIGDLANTIETMVGVISDLLRPLVILAGKDITPGPGDASPLDLLAIAGSYALVRSIGSGAISGAVRNVGSRIPFVGAAMAGGGRATAGGAQVRQNVNINVKPGAQPGASFVGHPGGMVSPAAGTAYSRQAQAQDIFQSSLMWAPFMLGVGSGGMGAAPAVGSGLNNARFVPSGQSGLPFLTMLGQRGKAFGSTLKNMNWGRMGLSALRGLGYWAIADMALQALTGWNTTDVLFGKGDGGIDTEALSDLGEPWLLDEQLTEMGSPGILDYTSDFGAVTGIGKLFGGHSKTRAERHAEAQQRLIEKNRQAIIEAEKAANLEEGKKRGWMYNEFGDIVGVHPDGATHRFYAGGALGEEGKILFGDAQQDALARGFELVSARRHARDTSGNLYAYAGTGERPTASTAEILGRGYNLKELLTTPSEDLRTLTQIMINTAETAEETKRLNDELGGNNWTYVEARVIPENTER